jgi:DNA (cytosine-5)-methyltransferase 1
MPLTFGSLFAGVGGFDLGFERAGMECKWQVEIDDYATRVLEKHWPDVPRWKDIKTFPPKCRDWSVDVICGGFPCQDISYAGKGAGLSGERSGLFYELIRVVRAVGPRIVVLENVAALLTRGLADVLGTLAAIGFDAQWHCIPASAVGAPHIRDRVFVIGHVPDSLRPICRQGDSELADANITRLQGQRQVASGVSTKYNYPCDSGWWAIEPNVGRVANGVPKRVDRLRGLGNAVVPQVAEYIGRQIVASVETYSQGKG